MAQSDDTRGRRSEAAEEWARVALVLTRPFARGQTCNARYSVADNCIRRYALGGSARLHRSLRYQQRHLASSQPAAQLTRCRTPRRRRRPADPPLRTRPRPKRPVGLHAAHNWRATSPAGEYSDLRLLGGRGRGADAGARWNGELVLLLGRLEYLEGAH